MISYAMSCKLFKLRRVSYPHIWSMIDLRNVKTFYKRNHVTFKKGDLYPFVNVENCIVQPLKPSVVKDIFIKVDNILVAYLGIEKIGNKYIDEIIIGP